MNVPTLCTCHSRRKTRRGRVTSNATGDPAGLSASSLPSCSVYWGGTGKGSTQVFSAALPPPSQGHSRPRLPRWGHLLFLSRPDSLCSSPVVRTATPSSSHSQKEPNNSFFSFPTQNSDQTNQLMSQCHHLSTALIQKITPLLNFCDPEYSACVSSISISNPLNIWEVRP